MLWTIRLVFADKQCVQEAESELSRLRSAYNKLSDDCQAGSDQLKAQATSHLASS